MVPRCDALSLVSCGCTKALLCMYGGRVILIGWCFWRSIRNGIDVALHLLVVLHQIIQLSVVLFGLILVTIGVVDEQGLYMFFQCLKCWSLFVLFFRYEVLDDQAVAFAVIRVGSGMT